MESGTAPSSLALWTYKAHGRPRIRQLDIDLPPLAPEQRAAALERAARAPKVQAELMRGLRLGSLTGTKRT
jgi:hypothetical protein